MVNDDRRGVLCDFGLAKIVQSIPPGLTTMGAPKGSMRWMAPELVDAPALKHTFATDIWAWGCLGVQVGLLVIVISSLVTSTGIGSLRPNSLRGYDIQRSRHHADRTLRTAIQSRKSGNARRSEAAYFAMLEFSTRGPAQHLLLQARYCGHVATTISRLHGHGRRRIRV